MAMMIRYVGEPRHGVLLGGDAWRDRHPVPTGSNGILIRRSNAGMLVQVDVDGKQLRFWAPSWQLRKLVKRG